jgi:undecaprenyl-diphosphatase
MKPIGDEAGLKQQAEKVQMPPAPGGSAPFLPGRADTQSRGSLLIALAFALLMTAVLLDGPIRALAQSLDPSVRDALRLVTSFGKSSWPLGVGLALLGLVTILQRQRVARLAQDLAALRSAMILLLISVAGSGFLASLSKHVIGRIRPSTDPEAQVLEFSVMAFRAGWAAFPSGHATTATAAALALAWCFPRFAWAWLALGLSAALSRALIGVHWFTDCLAGILLGAVVTIAVGRAMEARGRVLQVPPGALGRIAHETASQIRARLSGLGLWLSRRPSG